jgi:hypothetical protein
MWQLAGKAVETKALDLDGQIQAIDSHQATALKSVIIFLISHIKGPLSFRIRIGFSADPNLDPVFRSMRRIRIQIQIEIQGFDYQKLTKNTAGKH